MELKELLDLYEKLESRINSYWNFYTIVILAVLGVFARSELSGSKLFFVVLVLSCFFLGNLTVIAAVFRQIGSVASEIAKTAAATELRSELFSNRLRSWSIRGSLAPMILFHLFMDVCTITALVFLTK